MKPRGLPGTLTMMPPSGCFSILATTTEMVSPAVRVRVREEGLEEGLKEGLAEALREFM
jgi:hypothetical protein